MIKALSLSALLVGLAISGRVGAAETKDELLAQVGNKKITLGEFTKKFNEVRSLSPANPPTKQQFLEDLVRYEVGLLEAEKRGLEKDPIVQERMRQELYKGLLEKELGDRVQKTKVTQKEMEEHYKKNPELRTSHILIEFKAGATVEQKAEARKRATEILEEVKKSKRPFEELVKLYSDDPLSKSNGGDVGWQSRSTLVPSYYEAANGLKKDGISGLVETQFGFHIIKLVDRHSYENANHQQIRMEVFNEKRRQVFNEYFDKLKKGYSIKINQKLVE